MSDHMDHVPTIDFPLVCDLIVALKTLLTILFCKVDYCNSFYINLAKSDIDDIDRLQLMLKYSTPLLELFIG